MRTALAMIADACQDGVCQDGACQPLAFLTLTLTLTLSRPKLCASTPPIADRLPTPIGTCSPSSCRMNTEGELQVLVSVRARGRVRIRVRVRVRVTGLGLGL